MEEEEGSGLGEYSTWFLGGVSCALHVKVLIPPVDSFVFMHGNEVGNYEDE